MFAKTTAKAAFPIVLLLATAAIAQEAPVQLADSGGPAGTEDALEQITVTAEKHATNLQQTPIAISAIGPEQIQSQNFTSTRDLAGTLPGVNIQRAGISPLTQVIFVRGIGEADPIFDPAIAQYVDDVYLPRAINGLTDLTDLERVEVLRGPQGTLYGRNADAGAIRYITRDPTDDTALDVDAGIGNWGAFQTHGYLAGAIVPGVLDASLAYSHDQHDGYEYDPTIKADVNDQDTNAFRFKLRFKPTDDLDILLSVDGVKDNSDTAYYATMHPIIGGTALHPVFGAEDLAQSYAAQFPVNNSQEGGVALRETYTIDPNLTLKSITAYRGFEQAPANYNNDGQPLVPYGTKLASGAAGLPPNLNPDLISLSDNLLHYHDHEFTQELQLLGNYERFDFSSGLYYLYENFSSNRIGYVVATPSSPAANPAFPQDQIGDTKTSSVAAYGQVNYHIDDSLTATAGLRYTIDHRNFGFDGVLDDFDGIPLTPAEIKAAEGATLLSSKSVAASDFTYQGSHTWYSLTPKYGVEYQWTPDIYQYATISRGFRAGGYNNRAVSLATALPYGPETVTTYETGVKSDWFDHRGRLNLSLFYNDYQDLQQTAYGLSPQGVLVSARRNAGTAHTEGFELETAIEPLAGLQWTNDLSYLYSVYDDFPAASVLGTTLLPATGKELPYAPHWQFYSALTYVVPVQVPGAVQIGTDYTWKSRSFTDVLNTWQGIIPSQGFFDAFASYTSEDSHWTASASVHNIANILRFQSLSYVSPLVWEGPVNPPRTVFFKIAYSLGAPTPAPETAASAPPPPQAPPVAPAPAPERQRSFQVFFDFDRADLTDAARQVVRAAAEAIKAGNVVVIWVTGHTDTVGAAKYNQQLSERRATTVKTALVTDGVAASEVTTSGVGKTGLLVPTADGVREPQNRRAEIVLQ